MNLAADDDVLAKLRAFAGRPLDGHLPGFSGRDRPRWTSTGRGIVRSRPMTGVAGELLRDGSVDVLVRLAVREGPDPVTAITRGRRGVAAGDVSRRVAAKPAPPRPGAAGLGSSASSRISSSPP